MFENIYQIIEISLLIIFGLFTFYILTFAISALFYKAKVYKESSFKHKILILIPAYKEDKVIFGTAISSINQDYPEELFTVSVISDRMKNETNNKLKELGADVLIFEPESSTKAKALNFAIDKYQNCNYEIVVILDADNIIDNLFIKKINDAYSCGCKAIQAHRTAKNMDTEVALLDAISEEINNSIFRKGHIALGISSALIGSAMAFEFNWFESAVKKLETAGEDKELELLLLKEKIFINYLDDLIVLDEKTRKEAIYYNQRRRWLTAQFHSLIIGLRSLPEAMTTLNFGYIDKVLQWTLPPRIILLGFIFSLSLTSIIIDSKLIPFWWILLLFVFISLIISIPRRLFKKLSIKTLIKIPRLFVLTVMNFFRTKGMAKKFIHTPKS